MARRIRYVPQMEVAECGIACLAMILGYHGRHRPLFELREASGVGRDGLSAARLVEIARGEGLTARGGRLSVAALRKLRPFPCILHWKLEHFVVAEKATRRGLAIVDPAAGRRIVPWSEVSASFSGVALFFSPQSAPDFVRVARVRPALRTWLSLTRTLLPVIARVVILGFFFDLLSFVVPAAVSVLVDYVVPTGSRRMFGLVLVLVGTVALVRSVFVGARARVVEGVRVAIEGRIGEAVLSRLLSLELPFFAKRAAGDLAWRVQAVLSLRDSVLTAVQMLFDVLLMVAFFGLLAAYSARLTAILAAIAALRLVIALRAGRRLEEQAVAETVARGDVGTVFVEAFGNIEAVKALHLEEHFQTKLDRTRARELEAVAASAAVTNRHTALVLFLDHAALAALFVIGGRAVIDGAMALGVFSSFLAVEALASARIAAIATAAGELAKLGPTIDRLDDVACARTEQWAGRAPVAARGVELATVSFSFDAQSPPVVDGVSLRVEPGEHVALVGQSGSGKSTLLRLLLGLHRPTSGAVRIDGTALEAIDVAALRRRVGFVPAATHLFEGSLDENVALATGAGADDVARALDAAHLGEVVQGRRQRGAARVSATASGMSAGQCQRLLLARALVKKPGLLVLDEGTSALDEALELDVLRSLRGSGATVISATHRRQVMEAADRIVLLAGGRVTDEGTFGELFARSAAFRSVVA